MKTTLFLILFLFVQNAFSQLNSKTKWGEVSQAEIEYKEVSFDKESPAVILYEEGLGSISGNFQTQVYRRIKILTEEGLDVANQELIYYAYKGVENITNLKAQTINHENGKNVINQVDKNSFFETSLNEYYKSKKFTFPNVKVGSILEFQYTLTDQNLYLIDAWRFQHELPTLFSKFEIKNEMRLDYTSLVIGEKLVQFAQNKKDLNSWTLINVPSYNSLDFLYNPKDMSERIVFQLRGYMKSQGFDNSGSSYEDVLSTWKELNEEMQNQYNGALSQSVGKEIAAEIPNGKNENETLLNVYNFFKQNFTWNKFFSIYPKNQIRETQKNKSGNAADLNLLMNSILKNKGFNTELVLLSTRENGKIITSYPYLGQFNMVINLVSLQDGSKFLLDASDLSYDLGYAPLRNFNQYGLIVDSKEERFIVLHPLTSEYHSLQNYIFKEGKFLLTRNDKRNGYFKEKLPNLPKGIQKYNPQTNSLDVATTEIKRDTKNQDENNFELERIISESGTLENRGFISIENPLKEILGNFKLTEANRERTLEFNFPIYYKTDVVIDIPEGYKVEIPHDFNTLNNTKSNDLVYIQNAEIKNNKLIFHIEFYIKKESYDKNYSEIKSFFDKSNTDVNKAILLKKI